jgi:DNA (cytosine-5)-methyltransferase 1
MAVVGLYAGIGGLELGFQASGLGASLLADKNPDCRKVLAARFPNAEIVGDVADIDRLPKGTEYVTAGFPCQNLSMAGDKKGISGEKSADIKHLFSLLKNDRPTLVVENVYFMLHLHKGGAMRHLVGEVEKLGYRWAYRVVDSQAFGLPQRRRRVYFIASQTLCPKTVLFESDIEHSEKRPLTLDAPIGFYWTEGRSGVGLTANGIPPLKVASGLGIPSTPAVLFPDGRVLTPGIEACEQLQGFQPGWTDLGFPQRRSPRWAMVGNAVSVPASTWLAERLTSAAGPSEARGIELRPDAPWPNAAYGGDGKVFSVAIGAFPIERDTIPIEQFLDEKWSSLSSRALRGFLGRARTGSLKFPEGFLDKIALYLNSL